PDVQQQHAPAVGGDVDLLAGQRFDLDGRHRGAHLVARAAALAAPAAGGRTGGDQDGEGKTQPAMASLIHSRKLSESRPSVYSRPLMKSVGVAWIPAAAPSERSF